VAGARGFEVFGGIGHGCLHLELSDISPDFGFVGIYQ